MVTPLCSVDPFFYIFFSKALSVLESRLSDHSPFVEKYTKSVETLKREEVPKENTTKSVSGGMRFIGEEFETREKRKTWIPTKTF